MAASLTASPIPGRARLRNPLRLLFSAEPWVALAFVLLSFVLGVVWFSLLITLLAVGVGLSITLVGLPLLAGTMLLWIYGARLERRRVAVFLGVAIEDAELPLPPGPLKRRLWARLTDPHVWLDLLYLLLLFPLGVLEFVVAVAVLSLVGFLLTLPTYYQYGANAFGYRVDTLGQALAVALLGLPLLLVTPYVLVGIGRGHASLARALLGVSREAALDARVGQLSASRARAVDASLVELQRIERDLHDGAQQRLVKLAMDLGLAREKLKGDPAAAEVEALIAEAHDEAKRAMAEIRDLARGILPAVLTDRGLDPAISALAGRSPVPVTVEVCFTERLPTPVETTAYFVVAEALTNVARHSRASEAHVVVQRQGNRLQLDVIDDGVGGADDARGSGLAGLRDRLAALDGTLSVSSPPGGPTRVHAEIPLA